MKKIISILIIIILCLVSLTGCYDADGLEALGYVVAMGIDKGENDEIRLSLQFALLSNSSGGSRWRQQSIKGLYCNYC